MSSQSSRSSTSSRGGDRSLSHFKMECSPRNPCTDGVPIVLNKLPACAIPLDATETDDSSCYEERRRPQPIERRSPPRRSNYRYSESFRAIITPVTSLNATSSNNGHVIEFQMRRKNRTVTMQWEPFEGSISQSGVSHLSVQQSIDNLPPYQLRLPVVLRHKDTMRSSSVMIDPNSSTPIKFFISVTEEGSGVTAGDYVFVPGGSVSWITLV